MSETIEIDVLDPAKPIAAYSPIKAGIAALAEKYAKTVFGVATTKDMDFTKTARAEVREVRYNVESVRKELKAPALAYNKRIDAEAVEYTAALLAIEVPIDNIIKAEETRKAVEKAERERIEAEQRAIIQKRLDAMSAVVVDVVGKDTKTISCAIDFLKGVDIDLDGFGDRAGEAELVKANAVAKLEGMRTAAAAQEAEAARLKAERKKLADEQAEAKRTQDAEAEKLRKQREAIEADAAVEVRRQARLQADLERQRDEFEAEKAAAAKVEQDKRYAEAHAAQAKADAEARAAHEKAEAERKAKEDAARAEAEEADRRERVKFEENGPGYDEIVTVLATHYQVNNLVVVGWLAALDADVVDARMTT